MGILVNLAEWKQQREKEAHEKELREIQALRDELNEYMREMGEPTLEPYVAEEDVNDRHSRLISTMLATLDGYTNWPIDSSDL